MDLSRMDKTVYRRATDEQHDPKADAAYWLSRPVSERFAALEALRLAVYGSIPRLPRIRR